MFFERSRKDFFKELFVNISSLVPSIDNVQSLNVNGLGGAGALREPMDSNRSFPVMLTLKMVFAAFKIFRHMLDFKSSMSCLGLG